jgi:hypothetical protein
MSQIMLTHVHQQIIKPHFLTKRQLHAEILNCSIMMYIKYTKILYFISVYTIFDFDITFLWLP